jgi:hypothetical protein
MSRGFFSPRILTGIVREERDKGFHQPFHQDVESNPARPLIRPLDSALSIPRTNFMANRKKNASERKKFFTEANS